jgi:RNA polymerase sigma factor (sigma-70 family)
MSNYLDPEKLHKDYQPLVKSLYKKFSTYFDNHEDRQELYGQIEFEFNRLVMRYDPRRGVDFPCYIKRMLNQRVYHWVTKTTKVTSTEMCVDEVYNDANDIITEDALFERAEAMASLDNNLVLGKKQRSLMQDVLVHGKSLEEIASEEGIDVKVIRLRLHFLCKKLVEHNDEMEEYIMWRNK